MFEMNQRTAGILQLGAGATMISFSAVFVKVAQVGPTVAGFYRMLFGGLILLALTALKGMKLWNGARHLGLALACGIFFTLDLSFWHRSILYLGPGLSTLLANFQVFFLAAFGVIALGERPSIRFFTSILLAALGLYLLVGLRWHLWGADYRVGIFFGLITALCYSAYILFLRKLQSSESGAGLSNIALISLVAATLMGLEGWLQGEPFLLPDLADWGWMVGYGVVGQVLGWVLISSGILQVEASRVGLILLLQPTLSFVWDILFFGRPTTGIEVIGALLAILAIYLGATRNL